MTEDQFRGLAMSVAGRIFTDLACLLMACVVGGNSAAQDAVQSALSALQSAMPHIVQGQWSNAQANVAIATPGETAAVVAGPRLVRPD